MEKDCISDYNNMYTNYDKINYYGSDGTNNNKISYYKNSLVKFKSINDYKYTSDIGFKNHIYNMNLRSAIRVDYGFEPYNKSYDSNLKFSVSSYEERRTIRDQL